MVDYYKSTICCGKVSAKVGALIAGVLSVILSGLYVLDFGFDASGYFDDKAEEAGLEITTLFQVVCGVSCGLCSFAFIFSCLLLFATFSKRPKLLLPWIVIVIIAIVYFTVIAILEQTLQISLINIHGTITLVEEIISLIIFIGVCIGGLYVVKIEYTTLRYEYEL